MFDLSFETPNFSATTLTVTAESEAGKSLLGSMFGAGAVSIELPKSKGEDFARFVQQKGLKIG